MKQNYYITKDGILKRKQNTVYFIRKNENNELERHILPINKINSISAHGSISFSSGVVSYLAKNGVPIHFFNRYDYYIASLYPREKLISGDLLVKQVSYYIDKEKRIEIAKEFIKGCSDNIIKNLQYYNRNNVDLTNEIKSLGEWQLKLENVIEIKQILGIEGNIWNEYFETFSKLLPERFKFEKRSRQPPENMLNCLISFGNSLLYSTVLTEIYNTQLNPSISYLHEPSDRRFSLALDISEVFRPLIVDRVIFKLINKKIIDEDCFIKDLNYCLLNDKGKRIFLENYDEKLKTTIKHRKLNRSISFRGLIRIECYKLIKHLLDIKKYESFRIWW